MANKIYYSELKPFNFNYEALHQILYYYWIVEYIVEHFVSDDYIVKHVLGRVEYGAHWGGTNLSLEDNDKTVKIFIHTGLVYTPAEPETGIYLEAESWNNPKVYKTLYNNIIPSDKYDLNKEQSDFLKFYYPKNKLDNLMDTNDVEKQCNKLIEFYNAIFKNILAIFE